MQTSRPWLWGAVAAIMLAGCSRAPNLFADTAAVQPVSVVVLQADALVVDGRPVRLSNAVAPELAPRARCWAEALAARQARDTVQGLVATAGDVSATPTGGADEYNRALSRVSVDGVDLGQTLLDRGLAVEPSKARFDWCGPLSENIARGPPLSALAPSGG